MTSLEGIPIVRGMNRFIDHYEVLHVSPSATPEEIRKAYRAAIREEHPDRNDGTRLANERTVLLNEAYNTLKDSVLRMRHNVRRMQHVVRGIRQGQRARASVARHSKASNLPVPYQPPPVPPSPPRPSNAGLGALFSVGMAFMALLMTKNSYDRDVGRYRNGRGQFRKGPFS